MLKLDFNKQWHCRCLTREEAEQPVTLPHDAMILEPRTEESRGEGNIGWFIGGDYEYRKIFPVPRDWEEKTVLIEFEAVYHNAEVYINKKKAYFRPYGYTNFYVDTTGYLKYGEDNEVRVIARNADQPNSRWYSGTGIYRPAWLWVGGEKHIPVNGVRITTTDYQTGAVQIAVKTSQPGEVKVEILDDGAVVLSASGTSENGQAEFPLNIPNCRLWSVDKPHLYICRASFGDDTVEEAFGVRGLSWEPDSGLTINGNRIILRGACIHHDNGILGACAYPEAEERKVRILKEAGYNALRSAHYPCSKALLDACDRLGMLVMDEYVDHWYIHKTKYDYVEHFMDWWKQDLADMADKDYNHPCVIMYSTGNEVSETAQPKGIALTGQMTKWLHACDGTRPVTCGINIFFNFLSSIGLGVYSDDNAEKAAAETEKRKEKEGGNKQGEAKKPKKKSVGSEFYNMLAIKVGDSFMKWGATLPPCDWKTRGAYANMDIAGYNYGLWRYKHDLKKYPNRLILGSETFCKDAYAFWEVAKENPRIVGDFVWPGMDYMGEVNTGGPEFADYNTDNAPSTRLTGCCGRIDLTGKPRAEAAYTRVALEQAQGPFIAAIPVYEDETPAINGWMLTKALESWSYRGCEGKEANVEVYARAAEVELLLNGKSAARKKVKSNDCRTLFRIPYESGELTAVSYEEGGREIGRYTLKSAGNETLLRVMPEENLVRPGGLAFVRVEYTDSEGIWKPMEKHALTVTVEHGALVGLGNACPYKKGSFGGNQVDTYFGDALAVVRADGTGPVRITVTDESTSQMAEIACAEGE